MTDFKIINYLKNIADFEYKIENDHCTEISFFNPSCIFEGTLRKNIFKNEIIHKVAELKYLKKLNLRKCKVGNLPDFLSKSLEYLDISCNDITIFPEWILSQNNLKHLNVGSNNLSSLPNLSHLCLETLKIHKNRLKKIPKINNKIKSLNLYLNPLISFPNEVTEFTLLEVFSLGVTDISYIPSIKNLVNLRFLTLTVNELTEFPKDICQLTKIELIQLSKNKINNIPDEIGDLENLTALTLYSNEICNIPESFFRLKLNKLNLSQNKLNSNAKTKIVSQFNNIEFIEI